MTDSTRTAVVLVRTAVTETSGFGGVIGPGSASFGVRPSGPDAPHYLAPPSDALTPNGRTTSQAI